MKEDRRSFRQRFFSGLPTPRVHLKLWAAWECNMTSRIILLIRLSVSNIFDVQHVDDPRSSGTIVNRYPSLPTRSLVVDPPFPASAQPIAAYVCSLYRQFTLVDKRVVHSLTGVTLYHDKVIRS